MHALKTTSISLALGLIATTAFAQQSPDREILKEHCTGDYLAHCSEFAPGGPDVEACFRAKARLISSNCSAAIGAYQQKQGPIRRVSVKR